MPLQQDVVHWADNMRSKAEQLRHCVMHQKHPRARIPIVMGSMCNGDALSQHLISLDGDCKEAVNVKLQARSLRLFHVG